HVFPALVCEAFRRFFPSSATHLCNTCVRRCAVDWPGVFSSTVCFRSAIFLFSGCRFQELKGHFGVVAFETLAYQYWIIDEDSVKRGIVVYHMNRRSLLQFS